MKVEPLATERLDLRAFSLADRQAIFELRTDPQVNRFVHRQQPGNLTEVDAFIEKILKEIASRQMISWAIYLKGSTQLIGSIGYWQYNEEKTCADIGYELHPDHWRKGIMQEAFNATRPYFFEKMNFDKMEAWVNVDNIPSIKFLEKNNFQKIRLVPKGECDDPTDMYIYQLSKH